MSLSQMDVRLTHYSRERDHVEVSFFFLCRNINSLFFCFYTKFTLDKVSLEIRYSFTIDSELDDSTINFTKN